MQVLDACLEGNGPRTAWFGAPAQRTRSSRWNPNNAAYVNPLLILAIGNAGGTTTHEATTRNFRRGRPTPPTLTGSLWASPLSPFGSTR
jgi:hypothetical protein